MVRRQTGDGMNTTALKNWFGQVATAITAPKGKAPRLEAPIGDAPAIGAFVPTRLRTAIMRPFDSRMTGGDVRNY